MLKVSVLEGGVSIWGGNLPSNVAALVADGANCGRGAGATLLCRTGDEVEEKGTVLG